MTFMQSRNNYTVTRKCVLDETVLRNNRLLIQDETTPASAAYNMLRTQVLRAMDKIQARTLGIISARSGEGRTTTAINLALSLARERNHTALLVDLDFNNPCIKKYMGIDGDGSVLAVLEHKDAVENVLINPGIPGLTLLVGDDRVSDSSDILSDPKTQELIAQLKSRYDSRIIIFDLPAALEKDDAIAFLPYLDAVLVVVDDGKTLQEDLAKLASLIDAQKIIGTLLNRQR